MLQIFDIYRRLHEDFCRLAGEYVVSLHNHAPQDPNNDLINCNYYSCYSNLSRIFRIFNCFESTADPSLPKPRQARTNNPCLIAPSM